MFKVFGIQLAVHASFLLLLGYYAYDGWTTAGLPGVVWQTWLILLFFVCVVMHELGHSLTARRYGVRVPRILLLPIGGMAEMDHIPRKPSAELWITVAGPAVNFGIAAILFPFVWQMEKTGAYVSEHSLNGLVYQLLQANLVMGVFNLLPVFPMDGGRILRALLAIKLPFLKATKVAVTISRILAPIFAGVAFFYLNWPMMGILFVFIFFICGAEYKQTLRREEEERYWAEMAKRVEEARESGRQPPLIVGGPS
ncbi:site-2 protease family protein [Oleiharenicola lentus]|uniref:site-2 protease family protein n=1 Tax=Oleiharenicola lentus TaxID=2508720 RepID=UPI003F669498